LVNLDACVKKTKISRIEYYISALNLHGINGIKFMNNKIQNLLQQAEQQSETTITGESSKASASRAFSEASKARELFEQLKQKLFRIRNWNNESFLTSFELFDADGNLSSRETAAVGNFIRLSLTGSGKYDWVKIIDIYDADNEAVVTVKPSYDPTENQPDKSSTSHFFTSESTNNFCLELNKETVNFYVIGLSEKTNTNETESLIEKARNVAVANVGSYSGIQTSEWKIFSENFLGDNGTK
jgi:hypothetical protein